MKTIQSIELLKYLTLQSTNSAPNEQRDGCQGGWYWLAFDMVKRTQHLALESDYPYVARDGTCLSSSKPNGSCSVQRFFDDI